MTTASSFKSTFRACGGLAAAPFCSWLVLMFNSSGVQIYSSSTAGAGSVRALRPFWFESFGSDVQIHDTLLDFNRNAWRE
jgi:hypothetical protein